MNQKPLIVSLSPHVFSGLSIEKSMYAVVIALLPALAVSVYVFGLGALYLTFLAVFSCIVFEFVIQKYLMKVPVRAFDGSAALTGMLLAFNLPANLPWWMVLIGSFVAIAVAKMSFGGLGNNIFNPALVGRVFLLISFPVAMTTWPKAFAYRCLAQVDGKTAATPLMTLKEGLLNGQTIEQISTKLPDYGQLFLGQIGGSLGEISAAALLLGGLFLFWKKIITWHIPVSMIGTVFAFSGILWLVDPLKYVHPLFHILSGGVMLGAIYMATDYVSSPMTHKGMLIYGCLIGALTVVIRVFGAYPEGVSFAILVMNAFVPLINRYCKPHRFGE